MLQRVLCTSKGINDGNMFHVCIVMLIVILDEISLYLLNCTFLSRYNFPISIVKRILWWNQRYSSHRVVPYISSISNFALLIWWHVISIRLSLYYMTYWRNAGRTLHWLVNLYNVLVFNQLYINVMFQFEIRVSLQSSKKERWCFCHFIENLY